MFKGLLDKRWLVGRRLVLNFPNSVPAQVGIFELSPNKAMRFTVESIEKEGKTFFGILLHLHGEEPQTLATFYSQQEAQEALRLISKRFKWTFGRIFKWVIIGFVVLLLLDFLVTVSGVFSSPVGSAAVSSQAPAEGNVDPAVLKMLQDLTAKGGTGVVDGVSNSPLIEAPASSSEAQSAISALKGK